jgi:tetratricopeptide (TPR) repeat protein/O-antigen ligase
MDRKQPYPETPLQISISFGLLLLAVVVPLAVSDVFYDSTTPKLIIVETLIPLIAVAWVLQMSFVGKVSLISSNLYFTFLAFLFICIISLVDAPNRPQGFRTVFHYACYFFIPIFVFHTIRAEPQIRRMCVVMTITGGVVALIGLLQYSGVFTQYTRWNLPVSTLGNITRVAGYFNVVFPISVALAFSWQSIFTRVVAITSTLLIGTHILVLGSRGGWLGLIVCVAVFSAVRFARFASIGRKWCLVAITSCIVVGTVWLFMDNAAKGIGSGLKRNEEQVLGGSLRSAVYRINDGIHLRDNSSIQRLLIWKDTIRMIMEHPLLGVGVGNFEYLLPLYYSRESLEMKSWMEDRQGRQLMAYSAHNEYLELCAETGLLGLCVFGYFIFELIKVVFILLQRHLRGDGNILNLGLSVAVIVTLLHAFFSTNLQDPASAISFWLVVGMVWSLKLNFGVGEKVELLQIKTKKTKFSVYSLVILGVVLTISSTRQSLLGAYYFQRGQRAFSSDLTSRTAGEELELATHYCQPRFFAVYQALGLVRFNQKRWVDAISAFRKSLQYHPNNEVVHLYQGMALAQLGNYLGAVKSLRQSVELNGQSQKSRLELGKVLGLAGNLHSAIYELQTAIRIKPDTETYLALGGNFRRTGNLQAAADTYLMGLDLDPDNPEMLNSLGVVYVELGQFEPAQTIFEQLSGQWPNRIDYLMNLSVTLSSLGKREIALSYCRKILTIAPDNVKALELIDLIHQ